MLSNLSQEARQYLIVTGNYWAFTLTDGALRMLVVLHFHQLGYSPLDIALLFLFYEFFGVVTNLVGGWVGARFGLNKTMNIGLILQVIALSLLLVPPDKLSIAWVMMAQALSGIAKDLNKMSAKSAIKTLVPENEDSQLYRWVALLTGSKNALKGLGFFMGGVLLTLFQFQGAILVMAVVLLAVWLFSLWKLNNNLGKSKNKPKFKQAFSKNADINKLSAARLFLFGARDIWFVVALPVYLSTQLQWDHWHIGSFLACWVIAYGLVQIWAPKITGKRPEGRAAVAWGSILFTAPTLIAISLTNNFYIEMSLIIGLILFGFFFAINSSLHSYLIVNYAARDNASLDIGFYYMANAMGRLLGTVLSGWLFQQYGLVTCLLASGCFIFIATLISCSLPNTPQARTTEQ
ncbi:MAG: organoarsenical effux MFS transporter ArsJ [Cellvibrionaceae bacterium]